jgi:hypothetical protein
MYIKVMRYVKMSAQNGLVFNKSINCRYVKQDLSIGFYLTTTTTTVYQESFWDEISFAGLALALAEKGGVKELQLLLTKVPI